MSAEPRVTDFQARMLETLKKFPNWQASTASLASRMKTSRVAVVSAGRALERAGRARSWCHGNDEWVVLMWTPSEPRR